MGTFVVRVWLPDRPGALGAVASRIGAVRGDVVGIEILERGAGRVVDELLVELPDDEVVSLLVREIAQVEGVDVEDIRPVRRSAERDPLRIALDLVEQESASALLDVLVEHVADEFEADWVAIAGEDGVTIAGAGTGAPTAGWLAAFIEGSRHSSAGLPLSAAVAGPEDVAWSAMSPAGLVLVIGREHRPVLGRERQQLDALARIGGRRFVELTLASAAV